jgi:hypothetical protein
MCLVRRIEERKLGAVISHIDPRKGNGSPVLAFACLNLLLNLSTFFVMPVPKEDVSP